MFSTKITPQRKMFDTKITPQRKMFGLNYLYTTTPKEQEKCI
jgi:hypothetical protein